MFPSTLAMVIGAVVVALLVAGIYNSLVGKRQEVQQSWSPIETELRRLYDLIPNLVETVKVYAGHEHDTLKDVIAARNAAATQVPIDQQVASQNQLTAALGRLMVLSENYPQLKANEDFMQLQNELNETETRISEARRFYNANVKEYNERCQSFPSVLIAGSFGFRPQPYFGTDNPAAYEPVQISFGKGGSSTANGGNIKRPKTQKENR